MNYDQFIGEVQNRAHLPSQGQALRAIEATFQTLAERLSAEEARDLAAQLPQELGFFLQDQGILVKRFSLKDFFERVSFRENADLPKSMYHARVVIDVLKEAVSPGEIRHVLAQLPREFHGLFGNEED